MVRWVTDDSYISRHRGEQLQCANFAPSLIGTLIGERLDH
jgi:hypothetical protein